MTVNVIQESRIIFKNILKLFPNYTTSLKLE